MGKYYLYYCLDCLPEFGVAVCDSPAGQYEFLGFVRHNDGAVLGDRDGDLIQFDPGVFIDDDKTIYLYSGNAPIKKEYANDKQYSQVMTLEPDMMTLKEEPRKLLPSIMDSKGTGYEGHEFLKQAPFVKLMDYTILFILLSLAMSCAMLSATVQILDMSMAARL